jgi:predicted enzyme related to lactoylglutathione lyase
MIDGVRPTCQRSSELFYVFNTNKGKPMTTTAVIRKICLLISLIFLSASALAESPPAKILYVGSVSINPCQEAKVLADWYSRLGIETKEMQGGYYCQIDTAAGPFFFGIHPKKANAPKKSSGSVSVVFFVENFAERLLSLKSKGIVPESTEKDQTGQFAHFHDPDGNEVTLWGR